MRALRCLAYGEPERLVVEDLPSPLPATGEVLVDVRAASVNYPDVLLVRDEYQMSIAPPFTDRKSTRLNSSHIQKSRMPSSA